MCETDFSNAKVGDRVWSVEYGWGEIVSINYFPDYPICAQFLNKKFSMAYTRNGVRGEGFSRTLFHDEIKITPPPRPKRKAKKEVKVWANIYSDCKPASHVYNSKENADNYNADNCFGHRIACVGLTGSYEVEE